MLYCISVLIVLTFTHPLTFYVSFSFWCVSLCPIVCLFVHQESIVQGQNLRLGREKLQRTMQNLQEMRSRCEGLAMQVEESAEFGREKV